MKRKCVLRILSGIMTIIMVLSIPVCAAEQTDAVASEIEPSEQEMAEDEKNDDSEDPREGNLADTSDDDSNATEAEENIEETCDEENGAETAAENDSADALDYSENVEGLEQNEDAENPDSLDDDEIVNMFGEGGSIGELEEDGTETVFEDEESDAVDTGEENVIGGTIESYGDISWKIKGGTLTVEGVGDFCDPEEIESEEAPWLSYTEMIFSAEIALSDATKWEYMFRGCICLETVDFAGSDARTVTDTEGMFEDCSALRSVITPKELHTVIELPVPEEGHAWYLENGMETTLVPAGIESQMISQEEKRFSKALAPALSEMIPETCETFAEMVGENSEQIKEIKGDIWMAGFEQDSLVYTGAAITQDIRVYDRTRLLKKGTDYNLIYKNNTASKNYDEVGAPNVTIKLIKQYTGSRVFSYSIKQADIKDAIVSGQDKAFNYNGKKQEFKPVVKYCGKTLAKGVHYNVAYSGDTVGKAEGITKVTYTLTGIKNFKGTYEGEYYIVGANYNLSNASVSIASNIKYYGEPIRKEELNIVVKIKGKVVDSDMYDVTPETFDRVGTNTITIRASDQGTDYAGCFVKSFKITGGVNFNNTVVVNEDIWQSCIEYNKTICDGQGAEQATDNLLKDAKEETFLKEGIDYVIKYANNKKVGTAKVTFTGQGKYNGTITKKFKIEAANVLKIDAIAPAVYAKDGAIPSIVVRDRDDVVLKLNTDYTLKLKDHKKVGQASYKVTGKGNYSKNAIIEGNFDVIGAQLADDCNMIAADTVYKNKKNAYKSTPVLYDRQNQKKLKAGIDYKKDFIYEKKEWDGTVKEIEKDEVIPAGTIIRVTAEGIGNYGGTCSTEYKVYDSLNDISKLYVKIDPQVYTGEEIEPELSDGIGNGSIHLYENKADMNMGINELYAPDYVSIISYAKNIKVGTASVTLRACAGEKYGGQKTYKFVIKPKSIELVGVSSVLVEERYLNVSEGDTAQLTISVLPVNADVLTVQWDSEDSNVASVNESGFVKAVGSGITSITVTVTDFKGNNVKSSCRVFVGKQKIVVLSATPNDGKDDTEEFNDAIDRVSAENRNITDPDKRFILWVPAGVYHVDVNNEYKEINMKSNVTMILDDNAVIQALPSSLPEYMIIRMANVDNVTIVGGKVIGDRNTHRNSAGEGGHCINIIESTNVTIDGMDVSCGWGDGIYVGIYSFHVEREEYNTRDYYCRNIVIRNCYVHNNRRNNIALTNGTGISILNCTLKEHGRNEGLCIETNYDKYPVENVYLEDCTLSGSVKEVMGVVRPATDVKCVGCTFDGVVYNCACGRLEFNKCRINGELLEWNHTNNSIVRRAILSETYVKKHTIDPRIKAYGL